jgi:hypothetical protein
MRARSTGPVRLAGSLLLLLSQQFIEVSALVWREQFTECVFRPLHLLPELWGDRFHELFSALLAFLKHLFNPLTLPGRQIQVTFHSAKEFDPHEALVSGWDRMRGD